MYENDFRKTISQRVINLMQDGTAPWQCSFQESQLRPFNVATNRPFLGGNALLLMMESESRGNKDDPRWCTFKQASNNGWKIKRGEKAATIEYWQIETYQTLEDKETGEKKRIAVQLNSPKVSYVKVFHASQIEGIPEYCGRQKEIGSQDYVQNLLEQSVKVRYNTEGKMAYSVRKGELWLPSPETFDNKGQYYATALRGISIWAGYQSNLFNSSEKSVQDYAKEYFSAQLANWYLSMKLDLPYTAKRNEKMEETLIEILKNDKHEIFRAARDAEKIVMHVMSVEKQIPIKETEKEKQSYFWGRYSTNNYEVSTAGDIRFSALNAKLKDGRTIEEAYQLDVKGYRYQGNDWRLGKGKPPLQKISREGLYQQYLGLWRQWAIENPPLFQELKEKAEGKTLTDRFASSDISQAHALADLLQNGLVEIAIKSSIATMPPPVMQDLFQAVEGDEVSSILPTLEQEKTLLAGAEINVIKSKITDLEKENVMEEKENEGIRRNDTGRMDSVAIDNEESNRGVQNGLENIQSEKIPADGDGREHRQTDRVDTQRERSIIQGQNHDDSSGIPAAGGNRVSGGVPAQNENREPTTGRDERTVNAHDKRIRNSSRNFRLNPGEIVQSGKKTRFKHNIAAIQLLKEIETEGRNITRPEQVILAKYSGWGGITEAFVNAHDGENSSKSSENQSWKSEFEELKNILNQEEYAAARRSILNAHYTSPEVINAMWQIAERLGFDGGRVLEPSMGIGNFFGMMPEAMMKNSRLYGVELDTVSGRMAKQLYPGAHIEVTGFEHYSSPEGYFDMAISNVPFGDYKVNDPEYNQHHYNIHNYFFAKAMNKVRPGGLVMFITSTGTMEAGGGSEALRHNLNDKADLIGAVRLPNTAFKANAGTEVTTDIIVLQKRVQENVPSPYAQQWLNTVPSGLCSRIDQTTELELNEYYSAHREHLLGSLVEDTLYGGGRLALEGKGIDLQERLETMVEAFPKGIYQNLHKKEIEEEGHERILAPMDVREKSFFLQDNKIYQKQDGKAIEVAKTDQEKIRHFTEIKETLKDLLAMQLDPNITDKDLGDAQRFLNIQYDDFIKKHGYLNADKNIWKLSTDPEYGMVAAIEDYRIDKKTKTVTSQKRDIFTKRTIRAVSKIHRVDNASDALVASFNEHGRVDMPYMCKLLNQEEAVIAAVLEEVLYRNPTTKQWETSDEYLSGNVRDKLEAAKLASVENPQYEKNVQSLEKVQPVWLEAEDISIGLGLPWIPAEDIKRFAKEITREGNVFEIGYNSALNEWIVSTKKYSNIKQSVANTQTWGTAHRGFISLLEDALNQRTPTIYMPDPQDNTKRVVHHEATAIANDKLEKIKKEFETWIWKDEARRKRLVDYYNEHFNNWRLREYDGSHLILPGYSLLAPPLAGHQKDAVWRNLQSDNTLLGHCVGAGKTWTMQTTGMEMRRLGLRKKPMYVIPSSLVEQFEKEFRIIYPSAKLLTVTSEDLPDITLKTRKSTSKEEIELKRNEKNAKRQALLARIAMEDWDGIIISHELFKRIPMSPEFYNEFYQKQIDHLEQAIFQSSDTDYNSKRFVKSLENAKCRLEYKLVTDMNEIKKDIVMPFEQLGIDQIFVDEADLFKNLYFPTKMERISGLSNSDAQRSMDMFVKTQYITKHNQEYGKKGGVVFATGTPLSNTIAEMFTMMRYLDMESLERNRLHYFDNWAAQFAKIGVAIERSPDGNGYRKVTKILSFVNAPELIKSFRKFADIKQPNELNLKRPKLKNGQRTVNSIEAGIDLKQYIKYDILDRAKAIRSGCDPREDNMLKLTSDLRKASLDMRLIDSAVPDDEANGKLQALAGNVLKIYEESESIKGTQMIFCDLSTPKGASDKVEDSKQVIEQEEPVEKNVVIYDEIKKMLMRKGIPSEEIAFIHDAKTKEQKLKIIAAVNDGEIRVLLGSTGKLGAGTNAQKRLIALHHLDCPWVRLEVA